MVDYSQLKVASYRHFDVYLHENQRYLGRVFILLKEGCGDFLDLNPEQREEFFLIGNKVKAALTSLFQPKLFNYAALSNTSPQMHVHVIPRYQGPREFGGILFLDERFGKNYSPCDPFELQQEVLFQIRDIVASKL